MIRLACLMAVLATPALGDARQSAKFLGVSKAPGSVIYARGCGAHADVVARLAAKYGEARVGRGLTEGGIIEVHASEATGTWTALAITPDGTACVTAAGTRWHGQIGEAM